MYIRAKETFISAEKTQIYLGENRAARISGGGPTPTAKASTRLKGMRMVGLHLRAQKCGPDSNRVRSEMGFGHVRISLQIQSALRPYANKRTGNQLVNSG